MITRPTSVLVIGATGSIGRHVVEESIREGYPTRALVRDPDKARRLPAEADIVVGDVTRPETLSAAVAGIDGIVFTLGSDGAGKTGAEAVDYGGVRNVLIALGARPARIALMTSIGVTNRTGAYNRATEAHDWKRRSERLVRASGHPYAIVRPGWFDYNQPDELRLVLLQGDTRHAGDPSDGAVARRQRERFAAQTLKRPSLPLPEGTSRSTVVQTLPARPEARRRPASQMAASTDSSTLTNGCVGSGYAMRSTIPEITSQSDQAM
jgi:uncharacterized protein YbjT (DUF2867 family)